MKEAHGRDIGGRREGVVGEGMGLVKGWEEGLRDDGPQKGNS